jgi:hypothetical protein
LRTRSARCRGGYFNSGIALISCEPFCVEHCRFRGLARELSAQYGLVAVHVDTCRNGWVSACRFFRCANRGQPAVFVRIGSPLVVFECEFAESRETEVIPDSQIVFRDCVFGCGTTEISEVAIEECGVD